MMREDSAVKTSIMPAREGIGKAAELLKKGELVVFPTETVYGLGANAFDEAAVAKIFKAKGRPQDNPLIVHISDISQLDEIAKDVPETFFELAKAFMPGPLTIVLKKTENIPSIVTAGGETVAVRMPDNDIARELIARSMPLAAPSANRSKHISPTTAQHCYDDLCGEVELILDGGSCIVGIESTVLDLTADIPAILRPGAITAEMIAEVIGSVSQSGRIIKVAKSPGMKYTHYSPVVPSVAAGSIDSAIIEYKRAQSDGRHPVLVFRDVYRDKTEGLDIISLGVTAGDCMRNIYSALREAETRFDYIIVESLKGEGIECSVMNRVLKATGGREV